MTHTRQNMIRLVPNCGIQYLQLQDFSLKDLLAHQFSARVKVAPEGSLSVIAPLAPRARSSASVTDEFSDDQLDLEGAPKLKSRLADMSVLGQLLAASPDGVWLPVPYDAGGLWVTVFLALQDGKDQRVSVCLAVETTLDCDGCPEGLAADELGERVPDPCGPVFWGTDAARQSIRAITSGLKSPGSRQAMDAAQLAIAGLASYLNQHGMARLHFDARPEERLAVGVDVIVDLGNSRTCVLLVEQREGGRRESLQLVYPDDPLNAVKCPFLTQSAFVEHEILPRAVEGIFSFRFLSIIKMGQPALDALLRSKRDVRPLGISTPKRYLWEDKERVAWEWRCANREDEQQMSPRIHGDVLRRMSPRNPLTKAPEIAGVPAQPDYPRAACMVWSMVEILEQAFRQVNSPEWRRAAANAPLAERRRQIRNLVITYPVGFHSVELENLDKAASRAARLWSEFRSAPEAFCSGVDHITVDRDFGMRPPVVQLVCDEAVAIQVCWLYGESMHRFQADPDLLIGALGRRRKDVDTLRMASLDIGGGTIDLAISDYTVNGNMRAAVAFQCKTLFHDGISRAGDDVVRGILEEVVFPAIIRQCKITVQRWNEVFASTSTPNDEVRELRQRLVREVWMPVAMHCLSTFEASEGAPVRFEIGHACNNLSILDALQTRVSGGNAPRMQFRDVIIEADKKVMRGIVRNTIGKTIFQCADIIDQFDCDLMVVGGRPSSNPAIRDQIYASMAVPPGQVFFLSELAADDWYPFADGNGRIGDAKTCGVVGGWLAFAARHGMGQFMLNIDDDAESAREHAEAALIIGYLKDANPANPAAFTNDSRINFDSDAKGLAVMPLQPLTIASRRVDDPLAEARPIYRLSLKKQHIDALQQQLGLMKEVRVKFERTAPPPREDVQLGDRIMPSPRFDRISIPVGGIEGTVPPDHQAEDCFELRPRTLLDNEGYWIDTGIFRSVDKGDA